MYREKKCKFCDTKFTPKKRSDQIYCSYHCGKRMSAKKKAEEDRMKNSISCECSYCKKSFKPKVKYKTVQKYCSSDCKINFHKDMKLLKNKTKNHKTKICENCDKKYLPKWGTNASRQKFCSIDCRDDFRRTEIILKRKNKREKTKKTCPICNKKFIPKKTLKEIYCTRKCANSIQRRVYSMMRNCYKSTKKEKTDRSHKVLGYSPADLLKHLESFSDWKHLRNKKWHLDHKFPIIAFIRKGITDISKICCLENLQPLSGTANCKKNDSYDEEEFETWLKKNNIFYN